MKRQPLILLVPIVFASLVAAILTGSLFLGLLLAFVLSFRVYNVQLAQWALKTFTFLSMSEEALAFIFGFLVMMFTTRLYNNSLLTGIVVWLAAAYMAPHVARATLRRA